MTESSAMSQALGIAKAPVEMACKLIESLLGEPCRVAGGMLADQIYAWQWRNRLRIANRAKAIMEREAIAEKVVPPGFLLPLLEAAGNIEDPDLQEMWATLLVSGVLSEERQHPMFIDTLRRLDRRDAEKFKTLHRDVAAAAKQGRFLRTNARDVGRLVALQLLTGTPDPYPLELAGRAHVGMSDVRITSFGIQFAEAVGLGDRSDGSLRPPSASAGE